MNHFYSTLLAILCFYSITLIKLSLSANPQNLDQYFDGYGIYDEFPNLIHSYNHRRVQETNAEIKRGKLKELVKIVSNGKTTDLRNLLSIKNLNKVTFEKFSDILQCVPHEIGLDGNRGSMSMFSYIKPTRNMVELMCIMSESGMMISI